ncbi:hypothetical protein BB559_003198 [Furculomyces boomerangus]|uniref:Uncharacterized protein n=2 Tax=Harpellales TaxID=61421 RepID=A0A2T9YN02_9FUNG|nr:hypothetical protein BB559_003198 [Furculomyces boomerangus]PVZ99030.1 hypothetical protein BB558_004960 [Smittium angustum]
MLISKQFAVLTLTSFCISCPIQFKHENYKSEGLKKTLPEGTDIYTVLGLTRLDSGESNNFSCNHRIESTLNMENKENFNQNKNVDLGEFFGLLKEISVIVGRLNYLYNSIQKDISKNYEIDEFAPENKSKETDKNRAYSNHKENE